MSNDISQEPKIRPFLVKTMMDAFEMTNDEANQAVDRGDIRATIDDDGVFRIETYPNEADPEEEE